MLVDNGYVVSWEKYKRNLHKLSYMQVKRGYMPLKYGYMQKEQGYIQEDRSYMQEEHGHMPEEAFPLNGRWVKSHDGEWKLYVGEAWL